MCKFRKLSESSSSNVTYLPRRNILVSGDRTLNYVGVRNLTSTFEFSKVIDDMSNFSNRKDSSTQNNGGVRVNLRGSFQLQELLDLVDQPCRPLPDVPKSGKSPPPISRLPPPMHKIPSTKPFVLPGSPTMKTTSNDYNFAIGNNDRVKQDHNHESELSEEEEASQSSDEFDQPPECPEEDYLLEDCYDDLDEEEILPPPGPSIPEFEDTFVKSLDEDPLPPPPPDQVNEKDKENLEKELKEKMFNTRTRIMAEIVSSEESYVKSLKCIDEVFRSPLVSLIGEGKQIISNDLIGKIFSNVRVIASANEQFLKTIKEIFSSWDERSEVGTVFSHYAHLFRMYSQYISNHNNALKQMRKQVENNDKFRRFLDEKMNDPRCGGLSLESYLIMPIQRVPRYILLLEQLQKYTSEDHSDYVNIVEAIAKLSDTAKHFNEEVRKQENNARALRIQKQFNNSLNLVSPGRMYVIDSMLSKKCRKKDKSYHFFLFTDLLFYADQSLTGAWILHRQILINQNFSFENDKDFPIENKFLFRIVSAEKSFILIADSLDKKQKWLESLGKCIENVKRSLRTHHSSRKYESDDEDAAPVWTADGDRAECELCNSPFGIIKRRHHCRNCGKLVCGPCSKARIVMGKNKKKKRACRECASVLADGKKRLLFKSSGNSSDTSYYGGDTSCDENDTSTHASTKASFPPLQEIKEDFDMSVSVPPPPPPETDSDSDDDLYAREAADTVKAKISFNPDVPEMLAYVKGDKILITSSSDNVWFGKNKRTGIVGRFDAENMQMKNGQPLLHIQPRFSTLRFPSVANHDLGRENFRFSQSSRVLSCRKCGTCPGFLPSEAFENICRRCYHHQFSHQ